MKKIYKAPQIRTMVYDENLMVNVTSVGLGGSVENQTDTDWTPGGNGSTGDHPDAKRHHGFWDDEE